eukprot:CAMPEP_0172517122 /NCGR_PEP_ID=MMETSP1066-20121228/281953_1 /TAXON_ID=671091 /ORGANISM="Coscinodiscus wailesii, Strain CCMP2513" /LENGTH=273 /DNA_ID=CAMNT_0013298927 /DNA_START=109 /DNA_END=930 /DNA_ORIENTATION=+
MSPSFLLTLLLPITLHSFTPTTPLRPIVSTKLHSAATTLPEGITKTVKKTGNGPPLRVGDVATVKYSCYLPEKDNSPPFAKSPGQQVVVGDGLMIDGWELTLPTMRGGERAVISVSDAKFGYGAAGVPPIIPSNAVIEMDVEILNVEAGVDLGTIASADPLKPRTPQSIAAAYNTRRELAAMEEADQKEGLEWLVAKIQSSYFFGFFEGETGQQAPWYLRPSITFPLAFAVVGLAFYVQFSMGGITERGAQITDELDEVILGTIVLGVLGVFS